MQNHREAILFICGIVLLLALLAQLFLTEPAYAEPAYPVVDVDMEDMTEKMKDALIRSVITEDEETAWYPVLAKQITYKSD